MKKYTSFIAAAGMIMTLAVTWICGFIKDGRTLEQLRGSVLRLHILANSDSAADQELKLCVRDALLEHGEELFGDAASLTEAEEAAENKLPEIEHIAEETLAAHGCNYKVHAEIADTVFDERVYGDITMPAGEYRALRVEIGKAEGHNWWCVMYPPLCIPAAVSVKDDKETEEEYFSDEERDVIYHPKKYRIRFAIWDKVKGLF